MLCDTQQNTLVVTVQRDRVSGLDLCADVNEYEFTFHSLENVQQMSRHLAQVAYVSIAYVSRCIRQHSIRQQIYTSA